MEKGWNPLNIWTRFPFFWVFIRRRLLCFHYDFLIVYSYLLIQCTSFVSFCLNNFLLVSREFNTLFLRKRNQPPLKREEFGLSLRHVVSLQNLSCRHTESYKHKSVLEYLCCLCSVVVYSASSSILFEWNETIRFKVNCEFSSHFIVF